LIDLWEEKEIPHSKKKNFHKKKWRFIRFFKFKSPDEATQLPKQEARHKKKTHVQKLIIFP